MVKTVPFHPEGRVAVVAVSGRHSETVLPEVFTPQPAGPTTAAIGNRTARDPNVVLRMSQRCAPTSFPKSKTIAPPPPPQPPFLREPDEHDDRLRNRQAGKAQERPGGRLNGSRIAH